MKKSKAKGYRHHSLPKSRMTERMKKEMTHQTNHQKFIKYIPENIGHCEYHRIFKNRNAVEVIKTIIYSYKLKRRLRNSKITKSFYRMLVVSKLASGKSKRLYCFPTKKELAMIKEASQGKNPKEFLEEVFQMLNIGKFLEQDTVQIFLNEILKTWEEKQLCLPK